MVHSVSMELQRDDFLKNNLNTARVMFDSLIKDYPNYGLGEALSKTANIVHERNFENAIASFRVLLRLR